jgi:hypothetical protein
MKALIGFSVVSIIMALLIQLYKKQWTFQFFAFDIHYTVINNR